MRLLEPLTPAPDAPLPRANPVAKIGAAVVLLITLFVSLDGVTALVILAALVVLVAFSGLSPRTLVGRAWLIGLAAISIGLFNVLFAAEQHGPIILSIGPLQVGAETLLNGVGLVIRLLAIAMAGLLATLTTQPTDLADSLTQQLRVSPRFAIGALAAFRLLPLMGAEWQTIGLARRARGVDAGRNPIVAVGLFAGRLLALLVGAIRRATRISQAMEARGFGAQPCRTSARLQRMRTADWGWIAGAFALSALAVGISLALGTWRSLLG